MPKRFCEFQIGGRIRRDKVDRPAQFFVFKRELNRPDHVVQSDPTHVLIAASNLPAQSELERREHLSERPAFIAQDNSDSEIDDADSRLSRRSCGKLPFAANFREKTFTRSAFLCEHFITSIAIKSDGRRRDEHAGFTIKPSQRFS